MMNRRSFIKSAGIFSAAIFVSLDSNALNFLADEGLISGTVASKGKGIAGVAVSDGFNVVLTDAKGNFTIEVNKQARFIWVSTPAGYEFNTNNSLAEYYQKVNKKSKLTFDLKPLKQDDNRHNFIIWADPQVKNQDDVTKMMDTSVPDTKKLIQSMGNVPVHGIGVGDLVWDNHALFPAYSKAIKEIGIPFFQALGNHDMDYRLGDDSTSDNTFQLHFGPTYYSFNRGKAHYVVLDDVRYLGEERKYDGYIVDKQLEWLAKDLQHVAKDTLLIISLHIPVHNQVKNNVQLYDLVKDFKQVHIMSGHTHYNKNVIKNNVFEHNHGTVCGAWWTGPICGDGSPAGYGVYEVNGTELTWYYKGTGLDKKEQVRIYVDQLTNQKRLIANVWNYDPKWKVEYYVDGKLMGEMEKQVGFDPLAIDLYKGPDLPIGRTFAEPNKTDHLFLAHVTDTAKIFKVIVTDRFGNKYEQSL
jgi:hypothetical protein